MHEASATRSQDAADRARRALRELAKQGVEVNFARVAAAAGVTRQFLYAHAMLRAEIERLRDQQRALARLPVADRSSDASIRSRLRAALDDNQRLREQIAGLREELALAHGRVRELELDRRASRGTLGGGAEATLGTGQAAPSGLTQGVRSCQ
jgi:chromosome segregation ATPase